MKLDSHLICKTNPKTNKNNIVYYLNYRISVLQDRLFRIEQNNQKIFRDDATLNIFFRNTKKVDFKTKIEDDALKIITNAVTLVIKKNREDCYVILNNSEIKIDNKGNLLGTYRTLDGFDGQYYIYSKRKKKIKLSYGVCSTTGVAYFDDANSFSLNENGEVINVLAKGIDHYVFAYGNNYQEAIKALYLLTGPTPLIPRFAFGNWWSRYHAYSDEEYLSLLDKFIEKDIPLTVATIDMDWHYSSDEQINEEFMIDKLNRNNEEYLGTTSGYGWTGYTWNKHLFKDYKAFLKEIHDRNLKITLNLHPANGVRYWDESYKAMCEATNIDPSTYHYVPFDIFNNQFINAYFSILHKPYENDGVDFWWMDWQQGTKWGKHKMDPLWSLNHYHYLDHALNHNTPLILSRYCGIGSLRYPLGFSGDTSITWNTLKYLPYFTLTASNVGYTYWSHDIGGHHLGVKDDELYVRFIQYGVFSPILRLHCTCMVTITKEPWVYKNGSGEIAINFLRLRHSLIPFLYSCSYQNHLNGKALVEPLYYHYPDNENAYLYKNEYFFGDLLVQPITSKLNSDGFVRVKMWIPEGRWTDIFTNEEYVSPQNGMNITLLRTLDTIPVLARQGSIIPFSLDKGNQVDNPKNIKIDVYSGNGSFILYEDNYYKNKPQKAKTIFTNAFIENNDDKQIKVNITHLGNKSVIPSKRTLKFVFKNVLEKNVSIIVKENGNEIAFKHIYDYFLTLTFDYKPFNDYEIIINYKEDFLAKIKEKIKLMLTTLSGDNVAKSNLFDKIYYQCFSLEEIINTINDFNINKTIKEKLLEMLHY